ncbi:MAG: DUF4440 domain-containing protein [Actinomycetales bacterium]|nr:DUF4440 domain-containing protein [Actinomycetales bacterium]
MSESEDVSATDLSTILARVARLETAEAARAALYRYAKGADDKDWDLLGSAFTEDAVLEMPDSTATGRDAIVYALRSMLPAGFVTQHLMVNPQVEVLEAGRAVVTATVYYLHEGAGYEAVGWGDYRDEVTVVDGVGRISRKVFTPSQHLPGSVATVSERLARLETAEAAREATWRYATAIDTLDFDLLAEAFTEDAALTTRKGTRTGRDVVLDYYRQALADPVARKHFLLNQTVDVTAPGTAVVSSYFLYTFAGDDTSILGWGNYVDTVRVEDGVGRISEKRISIDVHADSREGWAGEITP